MVKEYKCDVCKIKGVKLWGDYRKDPIMLYCQECAEKNQDQKLELPGYYIGYLQAAIQHDGGIWAYSSAPLNGLREWTSMPGYLNSVRNDILFGILLDDKVFPWYNLRYTDKESIILYTDRIYLHNTAKSFINKRIRVEGIIYYNKSQNPMTIIARHISLATQ